MFGKLNPTLRGEICWKHRNCSLFALNSWTKWFVLIWNVNNAYHCTLKLSESNHFDRLTGMMCNIRCLHRRIEWEGMRERNQPTTTKFYCGVRACRRTRCKRAHCAQQSILWHYSRTPATRKYTWLQTNFQNIWFFQRFVRIKTQF